ncbi:MAG: hypothetical protein AAF251_12535 [Pseudomonadota bacterium]
MTKLAPTRRLSLAIGLAAGISLASVAPATAQDEGESDPPAEEESEKTSKKQSKRAAKGEKRLERMLEGRVAGKPVNCIRSLPTAPMTTVDSTAYVFGRGHTIYVQRTRNPRQIDNRDTLVLRRFGGGQQLCRQDVATTIDPFTQIFTGAVMFEDFVPYSRVDQEEGQASK